MSDIRTVLVKDNVIKDITPEVDFAVLSGAAQSTYNAFPTTSSSNSALIWNCQIPSENVIIDRHVLVSSGISLNFVIESGTPGRALIPNGTSVFNYGTTDAFQAFPLNSLFTTITTSINNTSLSVNLQDIFPQLLKMNSVESLSKYASMCPYLPDQLWGKYEDGNGSSANVLSAANNTGIDQSHQTRGCHPVSITNFVHTINGVAAVAGQNGVNANPWVSNNQANERWTFTLNTITTEPIWLSPFLHSESEYNEMGLMGINNLSLTCNIDTTCKRVFSSANNYITSISLANPNGFAGAALGTLPQLQNPTLYFRFLSSQPSDLLQVKNTIPMYDAPRFITSSANLQQLAPGQRMELISSNLQLNCIPDKLLICVRIPMTQQNHRNPSGFLQINRINVNFCNSSGLLSSASMYDLWVMSRRNGYKGTWIEFSGTVFKSNANNTNNIVPGLGSMLVISPAYDLSLPDYLTANSIGNFNLSLTITATNQYDYNIQPEICIVAIQSSILVTSQGTSSTYTGLLTKELVLATKSEHSTAMGSTEVSRITGGNFQNTHLTGFKQINDTHGKVRKGGAFSGGAYSGGSKLSKHY